MDSALQKYLREFFMARDSLVPRLLSFFCVGVGKERVW